MSGTSQFDLKEIFEQVDLFNSTWWRSRHIQDDVIHIYVRKSKRFLDNQFIDCFDIANISVIESMQGKGYFTQFLEEFVKRYPDTHIFVESILNPAVSHVCEKLGFKERRKDHQFDMYLIR